MCPVLGHGTTSYLPPFLHRYLHYVAAVVDKAVEGVSCEGKELWDLVELDGPSFETVHRWNVELTSIAVRERLLRRLPSSWLPTPEDSAHCRAEQAYTWKIAQALRDCFQLEIAFVTRLLQMTRLSLMTRYFAL